MFDLLATVLAFFYDLVPNYAVAIALLTLSVMVLLTPLTLKGTKSMIQMQRLAPEMKRLQAAHRGDRQKLNEEMMKFYQANKINPLGGCLPLLLQMPVFFVLYRVLHGLTSKTTPEGFFKPSYLDQASRLFEDLSSQKEMMAFGLDLSHSAIKEVGDSFVGGLPYLVLIAVVTATSYYQQRQISARNTGTPVNPQQQMLMRIMPAFLAVISLTLPSGLVVYFLVSNSYRILQQAYITRKLYAEPAVIPAALETTATDVDESSAPKPRLGRGRNATAGDSPKGRPEPARGARPGRPASTPTRKAGAPPSRVTPKGGRPTPQGPPRRKKR